MKQMDTSQKGVLTAEGCIPIVLEQQGLIGHSHSFTNLLLLCFIVFYMYLFGFQSSFLVSHVLYQCVYIVLSLLMGKQKKRELFNTKKMGSLNQTMYIGSIPRQDMPLQKSSSTYHPRTREYTIKVLRKNNRPSELTQPSK